MKSCLVLLLALHLSGGFRADVTRSIALDIPEDVAAKQFRAAPGSALNAQDSAQIALYRFSGDILKILAIYISWSGRRTAFSAGG